MFCEASSATHDLAKFNLGVDDELAKLPLPIESIIVHDMLSI